MLQIICGDALSELQRLPADSVHCSVTSPPYWGLRDYKTSGQLGLEKTPEQWCSRLVEVFRELRRVLHPSGTLWLNIGDAYASGGRTTRDPGQSKLHPAFEEENYVDGLRPVDPPGIKTKDMIGLPWSLAFALRNDGWWLRSEIIWHKPNPMPESVTDRPTKSHEQLFLLSKRANYFYDAEAIKEPCESDHDSGNGFVGRQGGAEHMPMSGGAGTKETWKRKSDVAGDNGRNVQRVNSEAERRDQVGSFNNNPRLRVSTSRNKRTVWTIPTEAYPESHFATFPTDLVKPCVLAGTSARGVCPQCGEPWNRVLERQFVGSYHSHSADGAEYGLRQKDGGPSNDYVPPKTLGWSVGCNCEAGGPIPATVLDPFAGSGTTLAVALELGRSAIGIELNPTYCQLAQARCAKVTPGLAMA